MSKIDDGGPAFPTGDHEASPMHAHYGMSLRDWFATHCPEQFTPSPAWNQIIKFKGLPPNADIRLWQDSYTLEYHCAQRYAYADAMIAARKTGGE